jgi:hypothetical protein
MSDNFAAEAQAALQLAGTAIEEGRISLQLGALQLAQVYARHGVFLPETQAAVMLDRWVGNRPAAFDSQVLISPALVREEVERRLPTARALAESEAVTLLLADNVHLRREVAELGRQRQMYAQTIAARDTEIERLHAVTHAQHAELRRLRAAAAEAKETAT